MSVASVIVKRIAWFVWLCLWLAVAAWSRAADLRPGGRAFVERHCFECHDTETKKGGLDLSALKFDPTDSTNFAAWVLVHDRVSSGQMPPKKKPRPEPAELDAFTRSLSTSLAYAEQASLAKEGRATRRRLN